MRRYIFMTGVYLPKPGATGMCVHAVAKHLAEQGNEVTTICFGGISDENEIDGVKIKQIPVSSFISMANGSKMSDKWNLLNSRLHKLMYIKQYPLRSKKLMKNYATACLSIVPKDGVKTTVIASFVPLEAVAALKIIKDKRSDIRTVYYSTDTLSNERGSDGFLSQNKRAKAGLRWENILFSSADRIIVMECHKEHYYSEVYRKYHHKMILANFPLLVAPQTDDTINDEALTPSIVYTGTLYRNLRNPEYSFAIMENVLRNLNMHFYLLGRGDCDDMVHNLVNKLPEKVTYLGMQSHEVAIQYINEADILMSIGNAESPMAPSKIYEYMATGKPIVHFYSWNEDPCIEPLLRYGNAILIKNGDNDATERLLRFLRIAKRVDFATVKELFLSSTPQYTAQLIIEA